MSCSRLPSPSLLDEPPHCHSLCPPAPCSHIAPTLPLLPFPTPASSEPPPDWPVNSSAPPNILFLPAPVPTGTPPSNKLPADSHLHSVPAPHPAHHLSP